MKTLPDVMLAAKYQSYGGPEALSISSVPVPRCGENEMLIRVHASTVNRTDCGFLRGKPFIVRFFSGLFRPASTTLGCELAGEIVSLGKDATAANRYRVGNRVIAYMDDDHGFGGHAQYAVVPLKAMHAVIPDPLSYEQAAPAFEGAHYAMHYIRAANIGKQHRVLINGATGAIGSAAVQLVHELGAHITAVCATEHLDLVAKLGADRVIDYQQQDFTALDERFDMVFDAVGKSTFGKCGRILTQSGIYMSTELGPYSQNPLLALITSVIGKRTVLFPIPTNTQADADYIAGLMQRGRFQPVIDRTYPLEQIVDAFRYVETGMKTGNVVLRVP